MKMLNKNFAAIAFLAISLLVGGCYGKPVQLRYTQSQSSDQKIDLNKIDFSKGREISAKSSGFQLFLFIPIHINQRHEGAYQALRAQAGNGFLTDIQIQESWTYAFIGTVYTTKMKAKVYPYKN